MKKYFTIIDELKTGDIFCETFESAEEAKKEAVAELNHMTSNDQNRRVAYYILVNTNPESLDGDILERYL